MGLRPTLCLTCSRKFYARYSLDDLEKYPAKKPEQPDQNQHFSVQSGGPREPIYITRENDPQRSNKWWAA